MMSIVCVSHIIVIVIIIMIIIIITYQIIYIMSSSICINSIYINIRLFYTCLNFMCLPKNKVEQNPDPKLQLDPLPLRVRDHDQPLVEGIFGYAVPPNGRNVHGRVHVGGVPADFPRSPLGRNRTKGGIFEALSFDDLCGDVS